jgi:hypothetical protein
MKRYLIEGSCDGGLFAESVDALTLEDAEAFAVERLCEAWGVDFDEDTTLNDLGDAASVREYTRADCAKDAAETLLAFVEQISRMTTQAEADGRDLDNDTAVDGLIARARTILADMEARPMTIPTIKPVREIGSNRAPCVQPIRVAKDRATPHSRYALHERERRGLPTNLCGKRSDFLVDGKPICRAHAGHLALSWIITHQDGSAGA